MDINGNLDPNFKPQSAYFSYSTLALAEQADKFLLVGGTLLANATQPNIGIVRLQENGSLDNSFTSPLASGSVSTILVQPDGKLVIGGTFTLKGNAGLKNIARLKPDGALDETFTLTTGAQGNVKVIRAQPDGKLLVAGDFTWFENSTSYKKMVRLQPNGAVDFSFSWQNPVHDLNGIVDLITSPEGRIYFATKQKVNVSDNGFIGVGSLLMNGSSTFFQNPMYNGSGDALSGNITSLAYQDGKLLLGGFLLHRSVPSLVARITLDGQYDASFAKIRAEDTAPARALAVLPDNTFLIGGTMAEAQGFFSSGLTKADLAGQVLNSFSPDLKAEAVIRKVQVQPDGKIIIAGDLSHVNGTHTGTAARLFANGTLDQSFTQRTLLRGVTPIFGLQGEKLILLNSTNSGLVRIDQNGQLDNTFIQTPATGITAVAVAPNGKIVVSGSINGKSFARYNADGSLDPTFEVSSSLVYPARSLAVQADGKVLAGKWFSPVPTSPAEYIIRLHANGTLDEGFSIGAGPQHAIASPYIFNTLPEPDGRILVVGQFTTFNGGPTNGSIIRLTEDGSRMEPFTVPGAQLGSVLDVARTPDNTYYLAGQRVNGLYKSLAKVLPGPLSSAEAISNSTFAHVSPNPFSQDLHLILKNHPTTPVLVRILSLHGQEMYNTSFPQGAKAEQYVLRPTGLAAGTYLVEIIYNGKKATQRLIKLP
nr:T9SS type A sorting domain-containing protein [Rufibacter sp. LB8]